MTNNSTKNDSTQRLRGEQQPQQPQPHDDAGAMISALNDEISITISNSTRNNTSGLNVHSSEEESSDDEEEDGDSIIHIIHSRFMQNQPNLTYLGEARLNLFQHFFIQSLEKQTSTNFVCIIRTDPQLHPTLKRHIIDILESSNLNCILIASNEIPKSQYQDILYGNVQPTDIWSGSFDNIRQYLRIDESNTDNDILPPRIIETRLDADDGLHMTFVETIQEEATEQYNFDPRTWRLWCIGNHAEWQYQSIWSVSPHENDDAGSIIALQVNYCVTAGLSIAFLGEKQSMEEMPSTMKHEKLLKTKQCPKHKDTKKDKTTSTTAISTNCRSFVPMIMGALRARTPTSAGMLNLVINGTSLNKKYISGATKQKDVQNQLWWAAKRLFGFSKRNARDINDYMKDRVKEIAKDNLDGQCTRGHSCKNSSQILLKSILEGG